MYAVPSEFVMYSVSSKFVVVVCGIVCSSVCAPAVGFFGLIDVDLNFLVLCVLTTNQCCPRYTCSVNDKL